MHIFQVEQVKKQANININKLVEELNAMEQVSSHVLPSKVAKNPSMLEYITYLFIHMNIVLLQERNEKQAEIERALREKRSVESELDKVINYLELY